MLHTCRKGAPETNRAACVQVAFGLALRALKLQDLSVCHFSLNVAPGVSTATLAEDTAIFLVVFASALCGYPIFPSFELPQLPRLPFHRDKWKCQGES